jgi:hypothetical protein
VTETSGGTGESGNEPTEIIFEESEVEPTVARPPGYEGVIVSEDSQVEPTTLTQHNFRDCNDAATYFASRQRQDPDALVNAEMRQNVGETEYRQRQDGTWEARVEVDYSLVEETASIIRFPTISWPYMTPSEMEAVESALDALRNHEEGHIQIVRDFARGAGGLRTATGEGETPQAAREAAQNNLQALLNEERRNHDIGLDLLQRHYDSRTERGRRQSEGPRYGYPGGRDAVLICPGQ